MKMKQTFMTFIFYSFFVLFLHQSAYSDNVEIIPPDPDTEDNVSLNVTLTLGTPCNDALLTKSIDGNHITLHIQYIDYQGICIQVIDYKTFTVNLGKLEAGQYFVKADNSDEFATTFNVTASESTQNYTGYSVQLTKGWHLLSAIDIPAKPKTIPPDAISAMFRYIDGRYQVVDQLDPEHGYWVKVKHPCKFILKHSVADDEVISINQKIIFEVEYVNYAWSKTHTGFHVNNKGEVIEYSVSDHSVPSTFWRNEKIISETELSAKYSMNSKILKTVSRNELMEKFNLIESALTGERSAQQSECRDAGVTSFVAYTYDSGHYYPEFLYVKGDSAFKNLSDSAREIYNWLGNLTTGYSIGGFCSP
ncbi:MAG: hypothetical protein OMM_02752 [Candidatus Magnetoglobus multicellularis str. Araruama]|uniref:Secretion system C-terminal sorting domain-containing protein n=1 Tax=Candidatus Magnetoglobus multicellularis str. Araruama TaxID=890399 RepID=A0A1V1P8B1_9BACT|nr:MAG: hypothetical protein OMM_02752 [Candidatus Magnetoglobus multicellularis str. Araruama]